MNDNVQILLNETWEHMKPVLMKEQARIEEPGEAQFTAGGDTRLYPCRLP